MARSRVEHEWEVGHNALKQSIIDIGDRSREP